MSSYYECHITLMGEPGAVKPHVERLRWKFSAIDGDPVLGEGVKCYATMFFKASMSARKVVSAVNCAADHLEGAGLNVIRKKVEHVLYDDRSSKVRLKCNGGCQDCHLDDMCP